MRPNKARTDASADQSSGDRCPLHDATDLASLRFVTRNVVVTYQVRPDALPEHLRLIAAIFDQLDQERPDDVEYKVLQLADGVSFVHVSTADSPDGSNPLTRFSAFREFSETAGDRAATPPTPASADLVGSYRPDRLLR
jgi:hypothetical protein